MEVLNMPRRLCEQTTESNTGGFTSGAAMFALPSPRSSVPAKRSAEKKLWPFGQQGGVLRPGGKHSAWVIIDLGQR
jgi:hypothetical protein